MSITIENQQKAFMTESYNKRIQELDQNISCLFDKLNNSSKDDILYDQIKIDEYEIKRINRKLIKLNINPINFEIDTEYKYLLIPISNDPITIYYAEQNREDDTCYQGIKIEPDCRGNVCPETILIELVKQDLKFEGLVFDGEIDQYFINKNQTDNKHYIITFN